MFGSKVLTINLSHDFILNLLKNQVFLQNEAGDFIQKIADQIAGDFIFTNSNYLFSFMNTQSMNDFSINSDSAPDKGAIGTAKQFVVSPIAELIIITLAPEA